MAWKATGHHYRPHCQGGGGQHTLRRAVPLGGALSEEGNEIWPLVAADFSAIAAYSFMIFNLLCAPCFAAMGAIKLGDEHQMDPWPPSATCACLPTSSP